MGKGSFLFTLGVIAAIAVTAYTGFSYYQNSQLEDELRSINAEVAVAAEQLQEYEGAGVQSTIAAKQTLDLLNEDAMLWSEVISAVVDAVPVKRGRDIVDILSYTGSGGEAIALSLKTNPGSTTPYLDVAQFIAAFDDSNDFEGGFVPSIAASTDSEGDEVLSFNFTTRYVDLGTRELDFDVLPRNSEAEEALEETLSDILEESLEEPGDEESADPSEEPLELEEDAVPIPR